MKLHHALRWELLLALSLVGCTAVAPGRLPLLDPGRTSPAGSTAASLDKTAHGTFLSFRVRWPQRRSVQSIPDSAETLEFEVKSASTSAVVASDTLTRPGAGQPLETEIKFPLDPSLGKVTIGVTARDDGGNVVASGTRANVVLRDNTTVSVLILLDATPGASDGRIQVQLDLLRNLQFYFQKYDHMAQFPNSEEFRNFQEAVKRLTPPFGPPSGPSPSASPLRSVAPYGIQAIATPGPDASYTISNPDDPNQQMVVDHGQVSRVTMQPIQAAFGFVGGVASRSATVDLSNVSTGNDGSVGHARLDVDAGQWHDDAGMSPTLNGLLNGTLVHVQPKFFGGQSPVATTIHSVMASLMVDPQGRADRRFSLRASMEGFHQTASPLGATVVPVPNVPFVVPDTTTEGSDIPVVPQIWAPNHLTFNLAVPSATIDASASLQDDLMAGQFDAALKVKDNDGQPGLFNLHVEAQIIPGEDASALPAGTMSDITFSDEQTGIVFHGVVQWQPDSNTAQVDGSFQDSATGLELGTLSFVSGPDVDMNRLANWPLLHLSDGTNYRLTPGFFSGQKTGNVYVEVH